MKQIEVTKGILVIGAGQSVQLTQEQASPRAHKLKPVPDAEGVYVASEPLQFIVGERLGVDGLLPIQLPFVTEATEGNGLDAGKPTRRSR